MRRRLAVLALAITALVVIAFTLPLMLVIRRQASERAQLATERNAQTIASLVAVAVAGQDQVTASGLAATLGSLPRGVGLVLPSGEEIGDVPAGSPILLAGRQGIPDSGFTEAGWEVGIPVQTRAGVIAVVALATGEQMTQGVMPATLILAGLGVVVVGAAVVVADRLGRNLVQPVDELAVVARRLGEGQLEARAVVEGPPEVAAVGTALNDLADRLGEMITAERESLADLSHRLRTPLTGLRLQAEKVAADGEQRALLHAVDRMQEAVDGLIHAVRAGGEGARGSDAALVVGRRMEFWRVLAAEQRRQVKADMDPGPLPVAVSSDELGSMTDGLIGNVFAHTDPGTPFEVRLSRAGEGAAVLMVGDAGPGFPAGFDPLRRGASGAGSTGLGLDIARRVAEKCGGTVRTGRGPLGGAEVVVTLPLLGFGA